MLGSLIRSHHPIVASQGIERLAALSDGIFSIAMTLLVLDIHVPEYARIHSEAELVQALGTLAPRLVIWILSITTLGVAWVSQQAQLNHIQHSDRNLTWIQILLLACVSMVPFSTSVLGTFTHYRAALLLYWANVTAFGAISLFSWTYARSAKLVKLDAPPELSRAIYQRVVVSETLNAVGAALCVFNVYFSIAFILVVQLSAALVPVIGRRR